MTSKIKVDNINKVSDDSNIINKCGTTITLGASGDSINLASGATQTGFGRTGTVDWQTTPKTATFTAADGEGYFINSGSAITMNLPAGSSGAIVAVSDYARNFSTYNFTISPNGSEKIGGFAEDLVLKVDGQAATFVYVDSTKGWVNVQNAEDTETGIPPYVAATVSGACNTLTESGDYKIATFKNPGTFEVTQTAPGPSGNPNELEYIVVGGGGAMPGVNYNNTPQGGGGAGGFRFASPSLAPLTYPAKPLAAPAALTAAVQSYSIVVGGGGTGGAAGPPDGQAGTDGIASSFSTITSAGGGPGGYSSTPGSNGGSGGGAACGPISAGVGNTPPVSPPQGNPGGVNVSHPTNPAPGNNNTGTGGGGGAIGTGASGGVNATNPGGGGGPGGDGAGVPNAFGTSGQNCGSYYYFAGGGGGGAYSPNPAPNPGGAGGLGGGGTGKIGSDSPNFGTDGTANTGGGGGSPGGACSPTVPKAGTNGGSGIVIIRYKFQN